MQQQTVEHVAAVCQGWQRSRAKAPPFAAEDRTIPAPGTLPLECSKFSSMCSHMALNLGGLLSALTQHSQLGDGGG